MKKRILCAVSIGLLVSLALIVAIAYGSSTGTSDNGKIEINNRIEIVDPLEPVVYKSEGTWVNLDYLNNISASVTSSVGSETAYVRTVFAFEAGSIDTVAKFHDLMCIRVNSTDWEWTPNNDWKLIDIDGKKYFMATATYKNMLAAGGTTTKSLMGVGMDWYVDNDALAQAGFGDEYEIITCSQAVQASASNNITEAFNATYGAVTADDHPWSVTYVSTAQELIDAIAAGKSKIKFIGDIDLSSGSIIIN